jgi:ribosomal silencing factor RsfS
MFEFKKRVAENPTKSSGKVKPYIEGAQADMSGSGDEEWNAVDCGSCVIHVLSDRARRYYDIEELWANGDEILHNGEEILTIDTIKID